MSNKISKNIIKICVIATICIIIVILLLLLILNKKNDNSNISKNTIDTTDTNYKKEFEVNANNKKIVEKEKSKLVEDNEYNKFKIQAVTEESLLNMYLEDYKYNAIYHIEDSYNSLDKDYREKRFGSIDEYEKYLNERQETIRTIKLSKYQINKNGTYDQYICLDQYDNYYIFNKLPNMSYTVILDTHTIDLPQFTDKYKNSNDGEKVGLNIEKFIDAINQKDYKYAYSVLDDTFKANNMPYINDFENYVKNNFYEKNDVQHLDAKTEGDYIVYNARITNKYSSEQEGKNLTIIMQLKENTDFVMSFSFE